MNKDHRKNAAINKRYQIDGNNGGSLQAFIGYSRQDNKIYTDNFEKGIHIHNRAFPVQIIAKPAFQKYLKKNSGFPDRSMEEQIHWLDKCLSANEKCTGCGVCAQVCPVNNIRICDRKPVWLHRCENCLACYHWCPNKAIQGGITPPKGYSYRHPDVKISDIMSQTMTD